MIKRIAAIVLFLIMVVTSMAYAESSTVKTVEAPQNLTVEIKEEEDGYPYFQLDMQVPESVKALHEAAQEDGSNLFFEAEYKVGDGGWEMTGGAHFTTGSTLNLYPLDMGLGEDIDIKANVYYFRVRFGYYSIAGYDEYGNGIAADPVYSAYSNIASTAIEAYKYEGASKWAVEELDKAAEYGLITDKIRDKMNAPITREELCEVIMKMYEEIVGEAKYSDVTVFSDTKNPEIYKAYELGIVKGVGDGKFAPKELTNREQVATMMYRAVKAINPNADFSTEGAEKFLDENQISSWALESVKFMSKNGLIKGSNGYMDPKGTTTREQAVLIVLRTYEKYK
ncbi:MAG TPA: S-layer homology domain-containing protein [Clostridiaceae bacterium]|nr:S-layer homology domain-containing protein [Clostridiaceae bacterium]